MTSPRVRIDPSTRMPFPDEDGTSPRAANESPVKNQLDDDVAKELAQLRRTIEARPSRYIELSARTSFSFLSGATPPEYMVFRAAELGYDAIGIADRDGLYGIVRACEEAAKHKIRIIIGCELTLEREGLEHVPDVPGKPTTLTVLIENHAGYTNLCKILTESHRRHPKSIPLKRSDNLDEEELPRNTWAGVPLSFVCAHSEGLWALADAALLLREDVEAGDPETGSPATTSITRSVGGTQLVNAFGQRLSVTVHLHKDGEDRARVERVEAAARMYGVPICATNRVLYARPCDKPILDVLHCIREGKTLDEAGRDLGPNTEAHLKSEEEMTKLFSLHPEWIARTRFIADRCRFSIKELAYRFPYEISDLVHRDFRNPENKPESAIDALRRLTYEGAGVRYGLDAEGKPNVPKKVADQIEKELVLIEQLEVAPYFLSVRAVVDMARRRDILCQGRGSAANSAVCFCLGITAVDPARSNMLFERFLSAERREPPDIDVDFEHERREEVIQEIYQTYGRDRAAMVCEIISYRSKSALREVGKVFGFSLEQVDRLGGVVSWWDGVSAVSESRLRAIGFSADDPRVRQTLVMARAIQGFPRHLSIHVGGFVLSAAPLMDVAPIEPATMIDRTIIPWDKDDIDTLGFFKIDVLGLGMLTAIRKCMDLMRGVATEDERMTATTALTTNGVENTPYASQEMVSGTAIERLARIPPEDPIVYDALCQADTVGVFQIESRAQMAMLPRLRPRTFYDLVIEVAIVRPGPIQGGMVHPYLRRRTGEEAHDPPHPLLHPILERTLGVPLFQEQVMQIAIVGAGYSGGEADRLRRDMAAWRKTGSLEKHRGRLLEGFRTRGIPEEFGERLYQQIHGFAEYGFPECVVGDTLVINAKTGERVRIEDVVEGRASLETTFACDEHLRLRKRRVLKATSSGNRMVYRLKTALGRELLATAEHPLLTLDGWKPLIDFKPGDHLATARRLPRTGSKRWPRHQIVVLADLIAEGNMCHPTTFYFYSKSELHRDEYVRMLERFPNTRATVTRHRDCFSIHVRRNDRRKPSGALEWAERLGLRQKDAYAKSLPVEVFSLVRADIALLLARLWEGDGHISVRRHVSYDTSSRILAEQIQHLLLRFDIVARVYEQTRPCRDGTYTGYTVTVCGAENLKRFYRSIGSRFLEPHKRENARRVMRMPATERSSRDIIPNEIRGVIHSERRQRGVTWPGIELETGVSSRALLGVGSNTKVGFRRWVIERLGDYFESQRLKDLARSDLYWDRVVSIEQVGVRPTYDLTIEGDHNFVANDFIVHNSHSASFALLVYASSWLKVHYPAEFAAALINSQPMGFYSPSTILQDAQRHGVELLPLDVNASDWDCLCVRMMSEKTGRVVTKIRLGLRLISGFGEAAGRRIEKARAERRFVSVEDVIQRAELDKKESMAIAESGALDFLGGASDARDGRRRAIWDVVAPRRTELYQRTSSDDASDANEEKRPKLPRMSRAEQLVLDYERTGVSIDDHPMKLLRPDLPKRFKDSQQIMHLRSGTKVSAAGLVTCRQRPGTASGVVFVTMEDEYGFMNLVLWAKVFEKFHHIATTARLLIVHGRIERSDDPKGLRPPNPDAPQSVVYIIADRLERMDEQIPKLAHASRDFH